MRRLSFLLAGLAMVAAASLSDVKPSQAYVWYPWCASYGGRDSVGVPSCGFTTFEQCMATVSGTQGTCIMNPFEGGPEAHNYSPRRRAY
jgi:hypothetical protein